MAQKKNKTVKTEASVTDFLNTVENEQKRKDCFQLVEILQELTGEPPKMWGTSIVGFGDYHYKYESGREGDFFKAGFSPRKANITLYIMAGIDKDLIARLGKYKSGKSCVYIRKLADIDLNIYRKLVLSSMAALDLLYGQKL